MDQVNFYFYTFFEGPYEVKIGEEPTKKSTLVTLRATLSEWEREEGGGKMDMAIRIMGIMMIIGRQILNKHNHRKKHTPYWYNRRYKTSTH